jgi:hypothetical protein
MNNKNITYLIDDVNPSIADTALSNAVLSVNSDAFVPLLSSSFSAAGDPQIDGKRKGRLSKRDELLTAAIQFFEQQDVTQFYTMTFAKRVSVETARTRFMEWIDGLEWFQRHLLGWLRAEESERWSGLGTSAVPCTSMVFSLPPHISTSPRLSIWLGSWLVTLWLNHTEVVVVQSATR